MDQIIPSAATELEKIRTHAINFSLPPPTLLLIAVRTKLKMNFSGSYSLM